MNRVWKPKNNFKQSITKQVRDRTAGRESDPYREVAFFAKEELNCDRDRAPATTVIDRDKSGLGKMGGTTNRRVTDQYDAIKRQNEQMRRSRLLAVQASTIQDNDPEFLAWCRAKGIKLAM